MRFWHEVDGLLLRQAADQADKIRDAFIKTVPVDSIVNRWADSRTEGERISPQAARDWAQDNITLPEKPLKDALDHVYATGWVIGDDASTAAYAHAKLGIDKAAPTGAQINAAINTDWANWKPGNRPAAALVRPPGGLKTLLDKADAMVADVNHTTLNRIGTLLADSLNSGASYDSLARNLLRDSITSSVIKDSARAQMIAVTEMSRALNTSTVDNYGAFGVEKVEWLAIDTGVCEICPANEAQGPIPLGEVFDSGDEAPPAHPNCRCTILPVVDEGTPVAAEGEPAEDFSTPEMEISDVADHGVDDVLAEAPAEPLTFTPSDWATADPLVTDYKNQELAIEEYTNGAYKDVNGFLRGEYPASELSEETKLHIIDLDSVMDKSIFRENITVSRMGGAAELDLRYGEDAEKLIGTYRTFDGYFSSSSLLENGEEVTGPFQGRYIKYTIDVPAGFRGGKPAQTTFADEREILLDRGSTFLIQDVHLDERGKVNVKMVLVDQTREVLP